MLAPVAPTVHDFEGLARLRQSAREHDPKALEETAIQFESLIIGIMLKASRDASLGEGLLDNSQTQQYLELMDRQVALDLARKGGLGFGKMLIEGVKDNWAVERTNDYEIVENIDAPIPAPLVNESR